jgi:cyanophycin synthetase
MQSHEYIPNEVEALEHALNMAKSGTFIVALSDVIDNALEIVQSYMERERTNQPNNAKKSHS